MQPQHPSTSSLEISNVVSVSRQSAVPESRHQLQPPPPQQQHHHYPVIQQPISSGDFRLPGAPPHVPKQVPSQVAPAAHIVSSSTCSPPSAQSHIIMRPPPPPPPLPLKISRAFGSAPDVKPSHQEEPTSSIPDLEFDGTTVLCRVCGDKASGFHYGVHSCEGCKGFFRRSIQQKIQYRPCTKNQQCSILRINRNRCQYCRLKKCIAVGMSRDAVRFGRVPKREKARILAAMQQSTNSRSQEKALTAELEDDQRLLATVVRAHLETCDFTRDKVEPMLVRARTQPSFTACPPTLACPLNPNPQPLTGQQELLQDFSKRFSPAIRGVVEFAKRITGFALLPQDDQVTLLKAGVFEVLLVRLACMFDAQNNTMICLNGQVLKRDSIHNSSNARFLMDSMFDFAERLNSLHLSDAEIGLFSSIVVIAADRPGLRNVDLIDKMHNKLKALLQTVLAQNHPNQPNLCSELIKKIPDLRTLNTLHSEKLLAFKMTEQQQLQQQHNLWNGASSPPMKYKQEPSDYQHRGRPIDECDTKSPVGSSSWSSSSEGGAMEEVKSPMSSVSSTESACSSEVAALNENAPPPSVGHQAANAPLLAATLAAGVCPLRHRDNSIGSMSGDDESAAALHAHVYPHLQLKAHHHHHQHQQQQTQQQLQPALVGHKTGGSSTFRKLDSPCDSGIESGTEKIEKLTNSAPTSVCSSPRSSLEDKDEHNHHPHPHHQQQVGGGAHHLHHAAHHHHTNQSAGHNHQHGSSNGAGGQSIDDMPVLKRVLQAPPLYDTNSLMDEAYKPHKKFRALRNKDTAEAEPIVVNHASHGSGGASNTSGGSGSSSSTPQLQHHLTSSLSSTHSTLAKSLMEGPRMTPEQLKRTDIIHNIIMRSADMHHESSASAANHGSSRCSPSQQYYGAPIKWEPQSSPEGAGGGAACGVGTSVITSSGRPQLSSSPYLSGAAARSQSVSPHAADHLAKLYLRGNVGASLSPPAAASLSSSSSPLHLVHHNGAAGGPVNGTHCQSPPLHAQSPPLHLHRGASPMHHLSHHHHHHHQHGGQSAAHSHSPVSSHSPSVSPPAHMISTVNLQVGITNSSQQPLNLSKKTPPSSPRPISASTTAPKIVSLEA